MATAPAAIQALNERLPNQVEPERGEAYYALLASMEFVDEKKKKAVIIFEMVPCAWLEKLGYDPTSPERSTVKPGAAYGVNEPIPASLFRMEEADEEMLRDMGFRGGFADLVEGEWYKLFEDVGEANGDQLDSYLDSGD